MGATYRRMDRQSDWIVGINQLVDRDLGNANNGRPVRWTQFDGSHPDAHGGAATTGLFSFILRSTVGKHQAVLLAATSPDATPTPANSVLLIQDQGLSIGAGKTLRLYDAAGTDYGELSSDADGGLVLGGSGASAGLLTIGGNLAWKSGTAFVMTFDHAATANRTVTFQDLAGTVALLGIANAGGNLLFTDATYDIGAAGATRPKDLYLSSSASIGTTPATAGAIRLANAAGLSFRNAANGANLDLIRSDASNNVLVGAISGSAQAYLLGTTGITLQVAGNIELAATVSGVTLGRSGGATGLDGTVTATGADVRTGFISPTALNANTDNWAPTGLSTARVIRLDASAPVNLTGVVAQVNGFTLTIVNISANTVTLIHDLTSTAANRFRLPGTANIPLTAFSAVELIYDGTTSRWLKRA